MNTLPRFSLFVLCLSSLLALPSGAEAETAGWRGNPAKAAQQLEEQWHLLTTQAEPKSMRGLFRFAIEASALGWHPERVEESLRLAAALQDQDPQSKTYGNFRWRSDHDGVFDLNGVEFAMQQAGLLHRRYSRALTPQAQRELEAMMALSLEGIARHAVKIDYTNIFLMQCWNRIAIGEALGRQAVADEGYRGLRTWLENVSRKGISEYGGVTYYGTDLDSLGLIFRYAARQEGKELAGTALRYLWTDIAANWWTPGDRLGGVNARSYDYLFAHGLLEAHTWPAGWLRAKPKLESAGWLRGGREDLVAFYDACDVRPEATWTETLRSTVPRTVVQRWGDESGQMAVHYVGRFVSLATSGRSRSSDERTLVCNLGDTPETPQLVLFMDDRGDPFGTKKVSNAANQAKALHMTPFIAAVQRGASALQLLSDDPTLDSNRKKGSAASCFLAHLTVPTQAEVWSGEKLLSPGAPKKPCVLDSKRALFIRLGRGLVAVRILAAEAPGGEAAPIEFVSDSPKFPANRITFRLADGKPQGRGTVALWVKVWDIEDEAHFAAARKEFEESALVVSLRGDIARLEADGMKLEVDVRAQKRQLLFGGEAPALLSVNGKDLGRDLLSSIR